MTAQTFKMFAKHASSSYPEDYVATKFAMYKMFPKLAHGIDSHSALASSLYFHNGGNAVAQIAKANPVHKSGILSSVKKLAPAVGGVMHQGGNPLRAAASGLIHAKLAGLGAHAAEIAGLGILARPSINHLRGKEMTEKNKALHETAGLGILAAPSAYSMGKQLLTKARPAAATAANWASRTLHH
jgi:hypothetical protein